MVVATDTVGAFEGFIKMLPFINTAALVAAGIAGWHFKRLVSQLDAVEKTLAQQKEALAVVATEMRMRADMATDERNTRAAVEKEYRVDAQALNIRLARIEEQIWAKGQGRQRPAHDR